MGLLEGVIDLDFPLYVQGIALSEEYKSVLGGHEIVISLPQLPEKPVDLFTNALLSPHKCPITMQSSWGNLSHYSPTNYAPANTGGSVKKLFFTCDYDGFDGSCERIQQSVDSWRLKLYKFICLEKRYDYSNNFHVKNPGSGIHLFETDPAFHRYNRSLTAKMLILVHQADEHFDCAELTSLFSKAGLEQNFRSEYDFMAQAYQEMGNRNYRYALVQALTAVEICISNKLSALCNEKSIDETLLLGKKSLGEKFNMLRAFGLAWPTKNPDEEITKHRNNLFHGREFSLTDIEVEQILHFIRQYLDTFSPNYFE